MLKSTIEVYSHIHGRENKRSNVLHNNIHFNFLSLTRLFSFIDKVVKCFQRCQVLISLMLVGFLLVIELLLFPETYTLSKPYSFVKVMMLKLACTLKLNK